jgi:hypothetical protein
MKPEIRNPKSEASPMLEGRKGSWCNLAVVPFRVSAFGFASDFGFRISDLSRKVT